MSEDENIYLQVRRGPHGHACLCDQSGRKVAGVRELDVMTEAMSLSSVSLTAYLHDEEGHALCDGQINTGSGSAV